MLNGLTIARRENQRVEPARLWLGLPPFATLALTFAGTVLIIIVVVLVRQFATLEQLSHNMARLNTSVISGQLNTVSSRMAPVADLDKASDRFFANASKNLDRTAESLPGVQSSLSQLGADAAPAFEQLSSGALSELPEIGAELADLQTLTGLPSELTGPLRTVVRELSGMQSSLGSVHGGIGGLLKSLARVNRSLAALTQIAADARSIPSMANSLGETNDSLDHLQTEIATLDTEVAEIDSNTSVLGVTHGK